ncbi:MAG: Fur family transcriptional regulator [Actinomycetota bacterium]
MAIDWSSALRAANVRPTRHRQALLRILHEGGARHVTAEALHREALGAGMRLSLATVYYTLHEFTASGLLRRIEVGERSWFCTNASEHFHFIDTASGRIEDIPAPGPQVVGIPQAPAGMEIVGVEVLVKVRPIPPAA